MTWSCTECGQIADCRTLLRAKRPLLCEDCTARRPGRYGAQLLAALTARPMTIAAAAAAIGQPRNCVARWATRALRHGLIQIVGRCPAGAGHSTRIYGVIPPGDAMTADDRISAKGTRGAVVAPLDGITWIERSTSL